jgi:hypothetical protein
MQSITTKLGHLKDKLESIAFLVTQESKAKESHKEIIQCLIILTDLESELTDADQTSSSGKIHSNEINKVSRRLELWAKRPNQINAKILTAFLKLEKSGMPYITENDLKKSLPNEESFESNFAQMKIIAEKNHGKVFEQNGEIVSIWPPVLSYVKKFEEATLSKN